MSRLLLQVIPMALAAAISPVLFLLQLDTLTGTRPIARGAALAAGAATVLFVVSSLGVALGGTGFSADEQLQAWINVGLGLLLCGVGVKALVHPAPPKQPREHPEPKSVGRSFLAGAGGMASNLTTFALYIPALALIAGSGLGLGARGLAALVIFVITLMVAWVPLVLALIPGVSTRILPAIGGWMTRNNRWLQVALGFGFGIWLAAKGVLAL
jgi:hypothetical protein